MIKQHSAAGSASQARRAATGTGALFLAILLLGGCGDRATPNESEGAVTAGTNQQDVLNEMGGMGSPDVMPGIGAPGTGGKGTAEPLEQPRDRKSTRLHSSNSCAHRMQS